MDQDDLTRLSAKILTAKIQVDNIVELLRENQTQPEVYVLMVKASLEMGDSLKVIESELNELAGAQIRVLTSSDLSVNERLKSEQSDKGDKK